MKNNMLVTTIFLAMISLLFVGCSDVTSPIEVDAPTELHIERLSEGRAYLSWEYNNQANGIYYLISRKEGENNWVEEYAESSANNFIDDIPTDSYTVYSYRIRAVSSNDDDQSISHYSDSIAYFSPLTKPTELTIRQITQSELRLSWEDNSIGEAGYRIDRKVGDQDWINGYRNLPANSNYFNDVFSDLFVDISYRVYAYMGSSTSPTEEVSFLPAYPEPHHTTAQQLSATEVRITWKYDNDDAEIVDGFQVFRKIGTNDWKHLRNISNQERELTDVPLSEMGKFFYRIRAYKDEHFSAFSEPVELYFNISFLGNLSLANSSSNFIINGNLALIANNYNGIVIVDLTNNSNPVSIGTIPLPGKIISLSYNSAEKILLAGNFEGKVFVIDFRDIGNPIVTHSLDTRNPVYDLTLKKINNERYILVANGIAGLIVVAHNDSSPTGPKVIGRYNTLGLSQSLTIEENLLYLGDGYGGVKKFDLSNPEQPVKIHENNHLGNVIGVELFENRLYLSCAGMGMRIIDKNTLQQIVHYDTQGYTVNIQPTTRYAYLADREEGMHIIHTVNNFELNSLALLSAESPINAVRTEGRFAYLLSDTSLQIIQVIP